MEALGSLKERESGKSGAAREHLPEDGSVNLGGADGGAVGRNGLASGGSRFRKLRPLINTKHQ